MIYLCFRLIFLNDRSVSNQCDNVSEQGQLEFQLRKLAKQRESERQRILSAKRARVVAQQSARELSRDIALLTADRERERRLNAWLNDVDRLRDNAVRAPSTALRVVNAATTNDDDDDDNNDVVRAGVTWQADAALTAAQHAVVALNAINATSLAIDKALSSRD